MDNESEVIRQQMEDTRSSLQDKLETLEQQVKDTVQNATEAVNETVSTVKEAVQDTVGTVKESVQETVDTVKDTLDLRQQVQRHPWPMFCGAAVLGFIGGRLLQRSRPVASSAPANVPPARPYQAPSPIEAASTPAPPRSWWDVFAQEYGDELDKVKGLAISTLGGLVREMATQAAPPALKEEIKGVVDSVTTKLGGHLLQGSLLTPPSETPEPKRGSNGIFHEEEEEVGSSVGGTRREWEPGADRFDR